MKIEFMSPIRHIITDNVFTNLDDFIEDYYEDFCYMEGDSFQVCDSMQEAMDFQTTVKNKWEMLHNV